MDRWKRVAHARPDRCGAARPAHHPFILLAAACYAKASPKLHARLLNHRWFGPMLRDWESDRSLTRRTKTVAVVSMTLMVALSIWGFQGRPLLQGVLLATGIIGALVVLRIPTRR